MIMKGQKISDRYQIIKSIGEGGMANVYLAYDTILDREVAVKVLRGDLASDEKFVRRFQREALAASSLTNPNVVEVYDVGEDSGEYYIVMEYVEGKHLKHLLKKRGKLTIAEVVDIALQITNGLSVAHESYLIHRDIKPQNILILDNGLIKITDFGIAVAMNATQLTQTNSVMGSVHYLPPEQAMGKQASLQSDIYSIGILLYELVAGKLPFTGDNAVEIALKHLKENVPLISTEVSNIPQSIENIIMRATAKNPKNRYPDAKVMHEDLKTCLDDSRKNEKRIELKYPETDYDEAKAMKIAKNNEEKDKKKTEIKAKEVEVIAKKVNQSDYKKSNKFLIILGSIFTGLVLIVTTIIVFIPMLTDSEQVEIPDVSNMTPTEAIKELQAAGFIVSDTEIEQTSKTVDVGDIIKTSPLAGSKRKEGFEVTLYVSIGNTSLVIEDFTGDNYSEVKGRLEALGLKVLVEKQEVSDKDKEYDEDEIIDQDIEEGVELSSGDTITLYIPDLDFYPDFVAEGASEEDVREFAEEFNLILKVEEKEDGSVEVGTVIDQSRDAGTNVVSGAEFTITIATKPAEGSEEQGNSTNDNETSDGCDDPTLGCIAQ